MVKSTLLVVELYPTPLNCSEEKMAWVGVRLSSALTCETVVPRRWEELLSPPMAREEGVDLIPDTHRMGHN